MGQDMESMVSDSFGDTYHNFQTTACCQVFLVHLDVLLQLKNMSYCSGIVQKEGANQDASVSVTFEH